MDKQDPDEIEGNRIILAEMKADDTRLEREHEYRMAKVNRSFITVSNPIDFTMSLIVSGVIISCVTALVVGALLSP